MRGSSRRSLFTLAVLVLSALVLGVSGAAAQSSIVNGVVKDGSGGGFPLYARIDITGPDYSVAFDSDSIDGRGFGRAHFFDPEDGEDAVTAAAAPTPLGGAGVRRETRHSAGGGRFPELFGSPQVLLDTPEPRVLNLPPVPVSITGRESRRVSFTF